MTRFSDKGFPSRVPVGLPCKAWEIEATDSFSGERLVCVVFQTTPWETLA